MEVLNICNSKAFKGQVTRSPALNPTASSETLPHREKGEHQAKMERGDELHVPLGGN